MPASDHAKGEPHKQPWNHLTENQYFRDVVRLKKSLVLKQASHRIKEGTEHTKQIHRWKCQTQAAANGKEGRAQDGKDRRPDESLFDS